MIISHKYKFIFIKTAKTAGTSVEIALSKYLGNDDIITPLAAVDENIRRERGYRGPQNFRVPFRKYNAADWARFVFRRNRLAFYNHAPAQLVQQALDPGIWKSYFKFCFERNPWDKIVSYYYWRNPEEPRPTLSDFIESGGAYALRGFELYTAGGEILVDRVCMFEHLGDEMKQIASIVGLPETPELPRTKATHRIDKRSYRQIFTEADRRKVSQVFAREIAHFGYEW